MNNIHSLEAVGRGSEAQLQVGENLMDILRVLDVKEIPFSELMRPWPDNGLMLGQRRRRGTNKKPASPQCLMFAEWTTG